MIALLRAVGRFWWDFVVGDDPRVAAAVAAVVVAGGVLEHWGLVADAPLAVGAAVVLIAVTFGSLVRERREVPGGG